jgi:Domain of unknown function (DUF4261)
MRLTMVALSESRLPTPEDVCSAYRKGFPEAGTLSLDAAASHGDLLTLRTPTCSFAVALVRAPISFGELRDPCAHAWYWPEAADTLKQQRGHLLITASSTSADAIELMLALTRVVASVAQSAPALGIFLSGAKQVHKVEDFVSEAEGATRELLPLYLWIRFTLNDEGNGSTTLSTTGLADLELMEVEFPRARLDPQTLMDRAFNIAHYLLDHGAVLEHGHTIGISTEEKFKVNHAPSLHDAGRLVYQLTQA